jgi:hypothetical protein
MEIEAAWELFMKSIQQFWNGCVRMYIYMYVCVCMYVCVYIHIYLYAHSVYSFVSN